MQLAVLTELFPTSDDPYSGVFVRDQLSRLGDGFDVRVAFPRLAMAGLMAPIWRLAGRKYFVPRGAPLLAPGIAGVSFVEFWRMPKFGRDSERIASACRRWMEQEGVNPAILHVHYLYEMGPAGVSLGRGLNCPTLITVHGSDVEGLFSPTRHPAIFEESMNALRECDRVIAVSEQLVGRLVSLGIDRGKITWIPNGVDESLFSPGEKREARRILGQPENNRLVLFVGNLFEQKGLRDLLDALVAVRKIDDSVRLVLIGDGPLGPLLRSDRLTSQGTLSVIGPLRHEEIPRWMQACDVVVLPSWAEGMPCVVLEALASGRPIVGTRVGAMPSLIQEGKSGFFVNVRDPVDLSSKLLAALAHEWNADSIRATARPFFWNKVIPKLREVYEGLVRPPTRPGI